MGDTLESWDGFRWSVRSGDRFSHDIHVLGKGEFIVLRMLKGMASKDKVFVDIGANLGYYTVRMARLFGKVIAIEPEPYNLQNLKANVSLNNLENVEIVECACGEAEGQAVLFTHQAMSTLLEVEGYYEKIPVKVSKLDDIVEKADVIKIDVEGFEEQVLVGAKRILAECKPAIIVEHHEFRGYAIGSFERIRQIILKDYLSVELTTPHYLYIPPHSEMSSFKDAIALHWIKKVLTNIREGRPWFYGLPYQWWWGMHEPDFFNELPNHVLTEEAWSRL